MASAKKNKSLVEKNLEIWSHFYPKEAVMLPYLEGEGYRFKGGHLVGPKGDYLTEDPEKWFKKITITNERVIVVYGLGWGEMYPVLKKWLKKDKSRLVVFIEEDPNVLLHFFGTPQAKKILEDPQVEVHFMRELADTDPSLEKFYWSCVLRLIVVAVHPAYLKWYPKRAAEFEHKVRFTVQMKDALMVEYMEYGVNFFRSFYFNMLDLPDAYLGKGLFGKFKGVPAIICGAGPSLEKQFDKLKKLKENAFILAGGSSLNALSHAGIMPHFSCGLDPNPEQAVRLRSNDAEGVPFFYRNRMYVEAFRLITGPRLYITGSGGYDVSKYFEERLGIDDKFIDEGHNVINFLCEISLRLGCRTILFVGLDLAYTHLRTYSKGVVDQYTLTEKTLPETAIQKNNVEGKPIWTEWKWLGEAHWIAEFAKDHPEMTLINCTEGGLGIEGIEHMSLDKAVKRYADKKIDLVPRLTRAISQAKCRDKGITHAKVRKLMAELKKSLERCIKKLTLMQEDAKYRIENDPLKAAGADIALIEMELMEEVGYRYILDMFNIVLGSLQNSSLRRLRMAKEKADRSGD